MSTPKPLRTRLDEYLAAIQRFESGDGQGSYSVVEIHKLAIADWMLEQLKLPTGPRSNKQW